jgi:hypothetical protein
MFMETESGELINHRIVSFVRAKAMYLEPLEVRSPRPATLRATLT